MDPANQLDQLNEARTQYHWAIANIAMALLCVLLAGGAFMFGYVVAGVLILVVSVALVVNAGSHRKRGYVFERESEQNREP
jgi:fatty-acid desaturase